MAQLGRKKITFNAWLKKMLASISSSQFILTLKHLVCSCDRFFNDFETFCSAVVIIFSPDVVNNSCIGFKLFMWSKREIFARLVVLSMFGICIQKLSNQGFAVCEIMRCILKYTTPWLSNEPCLSTLKKALDHAYLLCSFQCCYSWMFMNLNSCIRTFAICGTLNMLIILSYHASKFTIIFNTYGCTDYTSDRDGEQKEIKSAVELYIKW